MVDLLLATGVAFQILMFVFLFLYLNQRTKFSKLYSRFERVADADAELDKLKKQMVDLKIDYNTKKPIYDKLLKELSVLEESLEFTSYGLYTPHFDFNTSEEYEKKMLAVQELQKTMLKDKTAAVCSREWVVEGSKQKGEQMVTRNIKLMLRAFNGECDAAIMKVRWNNVQKMEERIRKSYEAINKTGESTNIHIADKYFALKLDELHLAYEYQEKIYQEREEQRQIREQMREEEKAIREAEKVRKDAEQEEIRWQKALDEAKKQMEKATVEELSGLNVKIADLEQRMAEAHAMKERAIAQAQLTKRGHIYVISNIGSFGKDVYKIGMTRRLEPLDRVKELGDASVPFEFDVHAIIFSENAPELENKLHRCFDDRRLNKVNLKKEFFNVGLLEIEAAVKGMHGTFEFTMIAEAKQYRESLAMCQKATLVKGTKDVGSESYPVAI